MREGLLVGGGALGAMALVLAFAKFLLTSSIDTLKAEIRNLGDRIKRNDERIAELEKLYDDQRKEKHKLANKNTRAEALIYVVMDLAKKCSCGALDAAQALLDRFARDAADEYAGAKRDPHTTTTTTTTT